MTALRHVLAMSRDCGSMQAILPVIMELQSEDGIKVTVASMEPSKSLLQRHHINAEYLDQQECGKDLADIIAELLDRQKPDLILSGSSPARGQLPGTPEQFGIIEGRRRGIPSVTVLDFWGMYPERFVLSGDRVSPELLPDLLCVLDERSQNELMSLGVPLARMRITHNPWLDLVAREARRPPPPSMMLQGERGLSILFVSQPMAEMGAERGWPYDQDEVLTFLLNALPARTGGRPHRILIWPHPAEHPSRWTDIEHYSRPGVEVMVTDERGASLLAHLDLVASSHSTVIYEALYYGTPCVSLRPGAEKMAPGYAEEIGLSLLFSRLDLLSEYLTKMAPDAERDRLLRCKQELLAKQLFFSDGQATRRVSEIVHRELCLPTKEDSAWRFFVSR